VVKKDFLNSPRRVVVHQYFCIFGVFKLLMRKSLSRSLIFVLSGLIILVFSCIQGSCFDETESYLKASFYNTSFGKIVAPDSLTLYGLNRDSIIYDKVADLTLALIPLNDTAQSSTFVIKINGITDTIEFRYSSYPHLISKECGYTYYHHLDAAPVFTKHIIDSILIDSPTVTNLKIENITIKY
jgi:hypothetical protein